MSTPAHCRSFCRRLVRDESGAEQMEYAVVAAVLVIVCIAGVAAFGGKIVAFWQGVSDDYEAAGV